MSSIKSRRKRQSRRSTYGWKQKVYDMMAQWKTQGGVELGASKEEKDFRLVLEIKEVSASQTCTESWKGELGSSIFGNFENRKYICSLRRRPSCHWPNSEIRHKQQVVDQHHTQTNNHLHHWQLDSQMNTCMVSDCGGKPQKTHALH